KSAHIYIQNYNVDFLLVAASATTKAVDNVLVKLYYKVLNTRKAPKSINLTLVSFQNDES
ncbi:MAG: hypothetical protein JWQ25_9, partial [Daejeonella sp.]|nr:hypothetical protein [Daejeonella sp.]